MPLLADILLAQGQAGNAREILERLYKYQPVAARPRLVQALLILAKENTGDEQLKLYEQVLELDATQPEARYHKFEAQLKVLEEAEQAESYEEALELTQQLAKEYSDKREWTTDLKRLKNKIKLAGLYRKALDALEQDDKQNAQILLAEVIMLKPTYKDASRYLHLAVTGIDVMKLQTKLKQAEQQLQELQVEKKCNDPDIPQTEQQLQEPQEVEGTDDDGDYHLEIPAFLRGSVT